MENLSLIVAIGKNNEIGKDNKLLWHIPEDLEFFKEHTLGKSILMGSNTFYSLPRLLPNRHHIVLTKDDYQFPEEVEVFYDLDELLESLKHRSDEVVVIGGGMIYKIFLDYVNTMYITEIDKEYDATVFFPEFDRSGWNRKVLSKNKYNDLKYSHVKYTRR